MDQDFNTCSEEDQRQTYEETNNGASTNTDKDQIHHSSYQGFTRPKTKSETFTESMKNLQETDTDEMDEDQEEMLSSRILLLDLQPGCLTLDTLPLEILLHICYFLEAKEIMDSLSNVCVMFNELFNRDTYWKTRICKRWPKPYPPVYGKNKILCGLLLIYADLYNHVSRSILCDKVLENSIKI